MYVIKKKQLKKPRWADQQLKGCLLKIPDVEKVSSPADKKTAHETEKAAANETEQKFRQEEYADMF